MAVWMSVKSASRQSVGPRDGATTKVAVYRSVEHAIVAVLGYVPVLREAAGATDGFDHLKKSASSAQSRPRSPEVLPRSPSRLYAPGHR